MIPKKLKTIPGFHFLDRIYYATSYYNKKYIQIIKWGVNSREDTNYTYDLSERNIMCLAQTISIVTNEKPEKILGYINEARNNAALKEHVLAETLKSAHKKYADYRVDFGRRLGWYAMVRTVKPKVLIETGIDKGLGSVLLCAALLENRKEGFEGHYYGTDINPDAGYLLSGRYKEVGDIMYGDSIESLRDFDKKIDLFINDSDHSVDYEYREYQCIKEKMSPDCVILGDNAHVSDKLSIFSLENNRNFLFFKEEPKDHWYPGAGIGISFVKRH